MIYLAHYISNNASDASTLTIFAQNDNVAIKIVRKIVGDGYRNEAFCSIPLSDGRVYSVANSGGSAGRGAYA